MVPHCSTIIYLEYCRLYAYVGEECLAVVVAEGSPLLESCLGTATGLPGFLGAEGSGEGRKERRDTTG